MQQCPECGHEWSMHDKAEGCHVGHKYEPENEGKLMVSVQSGCECELAHAHLSPVEIPLESLEVSS